MKLRFAIGSAVLCFSVALMATAQDAVKADPKHYKVETENAQVRVLRIHYGPHEKSVMHSHPASVVVFLTDAKIQFSSPDGKKEESSGKAGETRYTAAQTHLPENLSDKPFEAILVELKSGGAKAASKAPAK